MNQLFNSTKEIFTSVVNFSGLAYWVEIVTDNPHCIYYFGPFLTSQEANEAKPGYIEDLEGESALIVSVNVQRCQPDNLTIFDELSEPVEPEITPTFSGQMS